MQIDQLFYDNLLAYLETLMYPAPCTGDRVADKLAARGRGLMLTATMFPVTPNDIRELIEDEVYRSAPTSVNLVTEGVVPFDPGGGLDVV
ncbi:hypothetical protein V6N12_002885 [Hibiscus sabdariffa]|uniref:Uncharacterized protein n=1 Tax=Hibiscus sabdariffa TaxID=183260 RepID=A0ABR2EAB5_9ROSI